jgi:hypothetical protein
MYPLPALVDDLTTSLQIIPPLRWGGLGAAGLEYVGGQLGSGVAPRSWHCSGTQGSLSIQVAEDPHPLGTDVVHRIAGIYGWPSWSQSAGSNAEEHVKGIPTPSGDNCGLAVTRMLRPLMLVASGWNKSTSFSDMTSFVPVEVQPNRSRPVRV